MKIRYSPNIQNPEISKFPEYQIPEKIRNQILKFIIL